MWLLALLACDTGYQLGPAGVPAPDNEVTAASDSGGDEETGWLATATFGSAAFDAASGELLLNPAESHRAGSAFDTRLLLSSTDLWIAFQFAIDQGNGADGLTFTLLDPVRVQETAGSYWLGGDGAWLGATTDCMSAEGPDFDLPDCQAWDRWLPGLSLEIDTWRNEDACGPLDTLDEHHLALWVDGAIRQPIVGPLPVPALDDGAWHQVELRLHAPRVVLTLDGLVIFDGDVPRWRAYKGHPGFTASTGGYHNRHRVREVVVRD